MADSTELLQAENSILPTPDEEGMLKITRLESKLRAVEADLRMEKETTKNLITGKNELEDNCHLHRVSNAKLTSTLQALQADWESSVDELMELKKENRDLKQDFDKGNGMRNKLQSQLDREIIRSDELEAENQVLRPRAEELAMQVRGFPKKERDWEKRLQSSESKHKLQCVENEQLVKANKCQLVAEKSLREEYDALRAEYNVSLAAYAEREKSIEIQWSHIIQEQMLFNEDLLQLEEIQPPSRFGTVSSITPLRLSDELVDIQTPWHGGSHHTFGPGPRDFSIEVLSNDGDGTQGSDTSRASSAKSVQSTTSESNSSVSIESTPIASQDVGSDPCDDKQDSSVPECKAVEPNHGPIQKQDDSRRKPKPLHLQKSNKGQLRSDLAFVRQFSAGFFGAVFSPYRLTLSPQPLTSTTVNSLDAVGRGDTVENTNSNQKDLQRKSVVVDHVIDRGGSLQADKDYAEADVGQLVKLPEDGNRAVIKYRSTATRCSSNGSSKGQSHSSIMSRGLSGLMHDTINIWQSKSVRDLDSPRALELYRLSNKARDERWSESRPLPLVPARGKHQKQRTSNQPRLLRSLSDLGQYRSHVESTLLSTSIISEENVPQRKFMLAESPTIISSQEMMPQVLMIVSVVIVLLVLVFAESESQKWYSANQRTYDKVISWRDEVFGSHLMDQARWLVESRWIDGSVVLG